MKREQLFRYFSLAALVFLLYQTLLILSPFFTGILGAVVLTLIFFPMHRLVHRMFRSLPKRRGAAAAISTALAVLLIVVPFIFCTWLLTKEMKLVYPAVERFGSQLEAWRQGGSVTGAPWMLALESRVQSLLNLAQTDLRETVIEAGDFVLKFLASLGKGLPKNIFILAINLLVMVLTLFFLFRDGQTLLKKIKDLLPMETKHKEHLADLFYVTVTAVVRGVFIVAVTQGGLAGFAFIAAGVPSPIVLGFLTAITALVPLVGAAAVWLPVSLYYLLAGASGKGLFLLLWGTLVISLADNFLRPILIGSKTRLPFLFLFFGILGGVKIYGPMGLFLGPLVVALVIAFLKIYREEYQKEPNEPLPQSAPPDSPSG